MPSTFEQTKSLAGYRSQLRAVSEADHLDLTDREREIASLIANGYTSSEIAGKLSISVRTVGTHRQHIVEKLDLHGIAEITKYAIRHGLTTAERRPTSS